MLARIVFKKEKQFGLSQGLNAFQQPLSGFILEPLSLKLSKFVIGNRSKVCAMCIVVVPFIKYGPENYSDEKPLCSVCSLNSRYEFVFQLKNQPETLQPLVLADRKRRRNLQFLQIILFGLLECNCTQFLKEVYFEERIVKPFCLLLSSDVLEFGQSVDKQRFCAVCKMPMTLL